MLGVILSPTQSEIQTGSSSVIPLELEATYTLAIRQNVQKINVISLIKICNLANYLTKNNANLKFHHK